MRDIKFRAWDKATGRKFPGGFAIFGEVTCFDLVRQWLMEEPLGKDSLERMNDVVVEQFTSLYDKNGREIYEGDIVHAFYGDKSAWNGVIKWHHLIGGMALACVTVAGAALGWMPEKSEVIGNIHENPELLKA